MIELYYTAACKARPESFVLYRAATSWETAKMAFSKV